jgi:hypothetical protein
MRSEELSFEQLDAVVGGQRPPKEVCCMFRCQHETGAVCYKEFPGETGKADCAALEGFVVGRGKCRHAG